MADAGRAGDGSAGLLADLGHEVPRALLPSLVTSTLGAPAAGQGVIEGIARACPEDLPPETSRGVAPLGVTGQKAVEGEGEGEDKLGVGGDGRREDVSLFGSSVIAGSSRSVSVGIDWAFQSETSSPWGRLVPIDRRSWLDLRRLV